MSSGANDSAKALVNIPTPPCWHKRDARQRQGRIHRGDIDDRALGLLERAAEGHAHICCALALKAKLDRKSQNSRGENSTGTTRTLNEHALIFLAQTFGTREL